MAVIINKVKYPNSYSRMVQRFSEYEKEVKARLDAQVYIYRCEEHDQRSLEKLIPRKEIP